MCVCVCVCAMFYLVFIMIIFRLVVLVCLMNFVFPELCKQEGQVSIAQIMQSLAEENLPNLPPGGGLTSK